MRTVELTEAQIEKLTQCLENLNVSGPTTVLRDHVREIDGILKALADGGRGKEHPVMVERRRCSEIVQDAKRDFTGTSTDPHVVERNRDVLSLLDMILDEIRNPPEEN